MQISVEQTDGAGFSVRKEVAVEPQQTVSQIIQSVCNGSDSQDWGLFRRKETLRWLRDDRTVSSYRLSNEVSSGSIFQKNFY